MSKKELVVTNTIWYRIYNFFRKTFSKNKHKDNTNDVTQIKLDNNKFIQDISYRNEITSIEKRRELAEKLISEKLSITDLSDEEVEEMTEYFNMYINDMNQKIEQIKKLLSI